jgi:hypothetical protein
MSPHTTTEGMYVFTTALGPPQKEPHKSTQKHKYTMFHCVCVADGGWVVYSMCCVYSHIYSHRCAIHTHTHTHTHLPE